MANKTSLTLSLKDLKAYLEEWHNITSSVDSAEQYDSYERVLNIFDIETGEKVFSRKFKVNELISDNSVVSTAGIENKDLKTLIERCIEFDRSLAAQNNKCKQKQ